LQNLLHSPHAGLAAARSEAKIKARSTPVPEEEFLSALAAANPGAKKITGRIILDYLKQQGFIR